MNKIVFTFFLLTVLQPVFAQIPKGNILKQGQGGKPGAPADTSSKRDNLGFEHRNDAKDSITITYKFLDSIRSNQLDTNLNDFYKYYTEPASQQYLGNNGAAGYPLIFAPFIKPGWDAGFHAFDAYRYSLENTKFYKTTRPFTQFDYMLATGKEQLIKVFHTQNPRPNLNIGLEYRLITSPGFFVTQNANNSNYRLFSNYQGKRKRYAGYVTLFRNSVKNSENGGMINDSLLYVKEFKPRFTIPVNLGGDAPMQPDPFKSSVATGNIYKEFTFFLRQSYDIGKKDSVEVNDSTTEYLFYPKLRFQHTFTYSNFSYQFKDVIGDSALYQNWYDTTFRKKVDTLIVTDQWKVVTNDFSLLQFPDTKNSGQFVSAGAKIENIKGIFESGDKSFYNVILHGEYRNKTRNKRWDLIAKGDFYLTGVNAGDYSAYGSLNRYLNKKLGDIRLSFSNVNRSPSFIYTQYSSFNFGNKTNYKNENITVIKAAADNPFLSMSFANYLITNYVYFKDYHLTNQYTKLINLLQASVSKKIRLSKKWNWYTEITLQQTDGAAPIKVPLLFTRNRFAYEGVFFKNLKLSTGVEFRYYTPFNGYNYSPVMGQFMPQDSVKINNLPDISGFLHFRIKKFTAYLRVENLNAISFSNGFGFTNNNFAAPHYVYPGFIFRLGVQWNFVN